MWKLRCCRDENKQQITGPRRKVYMSFIRMTHNEGDEAQRIMYHNGSITWIRVLIRLFERGNIIEIHRVKRN